MNRSRALTVLALPLLCCACVSDFRYEPAPGHPARPDAPAMAPPVVADPADYEPLEAASDDGHMPDGTRMHHGSGKDDSRDSHQMPREGENGAR